MLSFNYTYGEQLSEGKSQASKFGRELDGCINTYMIESIQLGIIQALTASLTDKILANGGLSEFLSKY